MRELGRIVANQEGLSIDELYENYLEVLYLALRRAPRCNSYVNVLMNSLGYFSKILSSEEKKFFLEQLERYRDGKIPLVVPVDIIRLDSADRTEISWESDIL
jgi:uncharacterized protein YbgA (DUF1722 family)